MRIREHSWLPVRMFACVGMSLIAERTTSSKYEFALAMAISKSSYSL